MRYYGLFLMFLSVLVCGAHESSLNGQPLVYPPASLALLPQGNFGQSIRSSYSFHPSFHFFSPLRSWSCMSCQFFLWTTVLLSSLSCLYTSARTSFSDTSEAISPPCPNPFNSSPLLLGLQGLE